MCVCVCVCVCVQCNVFIEAEQIFKESSIVYAKDAKRKHWGEIYNIQKIPRYIDFAIWKWHISKNSFIVLWFYILLSMNRHSQRDSLLKSPPTCLCQPITCSLMHQPIVLICWQTDAFKKEGVHAVPMALPTPEHRGNYNHSEYNGTFLVSNMYFQLLW